MDSLFLLEKNARAILLKAIAQSFGCTYICLWSYLPSNLPLSKHGFVAMDRWYNEDHTRLSSSGESFSKNLFTEYCRFFYPIENGGVPGLAFKDHLPYLELNDSELLSLASNEAQRQFYKEAGIKTAIFTGCKSGEIEIGMSVPTHLNMPVELRKLFPEDFIQQFQSGETHVSDQNRPSSSSSSLKSLSMGSPEYPVLGQIDMASTSYTTDTLPEKPVNQAIKGATLPLASHQQTMQAYGRSRNIHLPNPANDDAAMARAMLAVISSPTSSSSSYHPQQTQEVQQQAHQRGAFRIYLSTLVPKIDMKSKSPSQNTLMRAVAYLRTIRPRPLSEPRPTNNQLHHMMSERKRREKLNESFQALRSLLPPGSKKDKASVLTKTREHLCSLKAQVSKLQEQNRLLEMQISAKSAAREEVGLENDSVVVQVTEAAASSSRERGIELQVMVREEDCELSNLVLRLLESLNEMHGINLASIEANTQLQQTNSFHRVMLRLNIQAGEWDEQAFREAVTRSAADVARLQMPDS